MRNLRIATININGLPTFYHIPNADEVLTPYRPRHKAFCQWLERSDIDIVCFQEVFTYRNLMLLKRGLPSFPYTAFKPFLFGPKGALVIFSKLPVSVIGYSSFLSSTGEVNDAQIPKSNILRAALKGILVASVDGLPLTLVNTHLIYSGKDLNLADRFESIHKAQLYVLSSQVKKQMATDRDKKVVVAGDLNIQVGELTGDFLKKSNLYDLFDGDDAPSFHNEFLADIKTTGRIDFIMTSDRASVTEAKPQRIFTQRVQLDSGQKVYLSDHEGLAANIGYF